MDNILKKDAIQRVALKAWVDSGKHGSLEITTGVGKTFIALHALYELPIDWSINHYFFAEVTDRKLDLIAQIKLYNKIFNKDVLSDYNLQFETYQAACKWKGESIGLAIFDEIHELLSEKRFNLFENNSFKYTLGLSATINQETYYPTINMTKGEMLNKVAPICFTYNLDESLTNGTSRNLDVYVINHELDFVNKTIKAGSVKKPFYQTEKSYYTFWNTFFKKAMSEQINYDTVAKEGDAEYKRRLSDTEKSKQSKIRIGMTRRSNALYNLPSKIPIVQKLLSKMVGKTIIFGNSLNSLLQITPNVVSSRNSKTTNNCIREDFDNNRINTIGSFKKLEQGANLEGLDNVIMMSYYSKHKNLAQRLGRLRENGEIGNVFILVTKGTQEEVWFDKMFEDINNLNLIYCKDIKDCLNKINNENK